MHALATLQVPTGAVAIHWFEQSTYALKDDQGITVQIDPYYPHNRPPENFIHTKPPLDEATLPTDYVLLTHDHGDHTWPESLARIWQSFPHAKFIGPAESIRRILAETKIDPHHTITIGAGDTVELGPIKVHAVYAKPPNGDPEAGIKPPDVTHLGYVVEMSGHKLYFTGDPLHTFADRDDLIAPVAALKPEIGFLTNHPNEGEFPFFAGSAKMAQRIGLKQAVPAHYQCFVKRNYDPKEWAAEFPTGGPRPLIIPYNSSIIYTG
ncbi:MAG: MBL fold metallo-hydrolase [Chloroflexi bacterium]|nr:MBL fold metallo-hydrolase [Chloroflexota bacterium]